MRRRVSRRARCAFVATKAQRARRDRGRAVRALIQVPTQRTQRSQRSQRRDLLHLLLCDLCDLCGLCADHHAPKCPPTHPNAPSKCDFAKRTHCGPFGCIWVHSRAARLAPASASDHPLAPVNVNIDLAKRTHRYRVSNWQNEATVAKSAATTTAATIYIMHPRTNSVGSTLADPLRRGSQQPPNGCALDVRLFRVLPVTAQQARSPSRPSGKFLQLHGLCIISAEYQRSTRAAAEGRVSRAIGFRVRVCSLTHAQRPPADPARSALRAGAFSQESGHVQRPPGGDSVH